MKKLTPFWQELNIGRKGVFFMGTTAQKNFIKEMIKENQFQNVGDIYGYLKDLIKDTIQEMLEAELDVSIGYPNVFCNSFLVLSKVS